MLHQVPILSLFAKCPWLLWHLEYTGRQSELVAKRACWRTRKMPSFPEDSAPVGKMKIPRGILVDTHD